MLSKVYTGGPTEKEIVSLKSQLQRLHAQNIAIFALILLPKKTITIKLITWLIKMNISLIFPLTCSRVYILVCVQCTELSINRQEAMWGKPP